VSDAYALEGEFKRLMSENANLRSENATLMEQLSHYERLLTANEAMVKGRIYSLEVDLSRLRGYAKDRDELLSAMPDIELFVKHLNDDLLVCCVPMDRLRVLVRHWREAVEKSEPIKLEYADLDRLRRERDALLTAAKGVSSMLVVGQWAAMWPDGFMCRGCKVDQEPHLPGCLWEKATSDLRAAVAACKEGE
jgi:hypothetical protein